MGIFGSSHVDRYDLAAGFSCMITCSDIPDEYEDGRFHILALGVYIRLDKVAYIAKARGQDKFSSVTVRFL